MSIKALVRQLANTDLQDEHSLAIATVVSVQESTATCTIELTGGKTVNLRSGVRLMATQADGFFVVPAIGSQVIVVWSTRNDPYVAMFSQIQDIYLEADNIVTLQGNQFGGIPKIVPLMQSINALETAFNALNAKVNTLAPTPVINPLIITQQSQIENPKVVHGS